jgi:hypothetical protein
MEVVRVITYVVRSLMGERLKKKKKKKSGQTELNVRKTAMLSRPLALYSISISHPQPRLGVQDRVQCGGARPY